MSSSWFSFWLHKSQVEVNCRDRCLLRVGEAESEGECWVAVFRLAVRKYKAIWHSDLKMYLWNYVNSVNLVKLVAFLKRGQFFLYSWVSSWISPACHEDWSPRCFYFFCCADLCWFSSVSFPSSYAAAVCFRSSNVPADHHTLSGTAIVHSQFSLWS